MKRPWMVEREETRGKIMWKRVGGRYAVRRKRQKGQERFLMKEIQQSLPHTEARPQAFSSHSITALHSPAISLHTGSDSSTPLTSPPTVRTYYTFHFILICISSLIKLWYNQKYYRHVSIVLIHAIIIIQYNIQCHGNGSAVH